MHLLQIDIRTCIFLLCMGNIFFTLAYMSSMRFRMTKICDQLFISGKFLQAIAWFLIVLHGNINTYISVILANALLLTGVSLEAWSFMTLQNFADKKIRNLFIITVLTGLILWSEPFFMQLLNFKFLLLSFAGAYIFFVPGFFYMEMKNTSSLKKLIGLLYLTISLITLLKGIYACFYSEYDVLESNIYQVTFYCIFFLFMGATISGYILLKNESLHVKLRRASITDYLTRAYNRKGFYDIAEKYLYKALREHESVCLISCSIDQLKDINETYGHKQGDISLERVASVILQTLRKYDILCRHGGNEFVMLLPNTPSEHAGGIAERIQLFVQKNSRDPLLQMPHSLSIGIYTGFPSGEKTLDDYVKLSTQAMDEAKNAGTGKTVIQENTTGYFKTI